MAPLRSRDLHARDLDLGNPGGDELIRFCIAFTTTAGVFVAFRVGIRAKRKLLGWDDFWIGVAFLFSILLMVATIMSVKDGFGMHSKDLTNARIHNALFWWYLNQIFYKAITWPTKISILLMYRRVFLVSDDVKAYGVQFRYLIWITMAIVVGCFISFETAGIFQCTPVRHAWNQSVPGHCTDKMSRMYAYAGCNFVTDLIILMLPMPLINSMTHITRRQKLGLMAVFALGGFVCITTLLRISKLHLGTDVLYSGQPSVLWTVIEANIGIICACLPLMRSVVVYLIPWFADHASSIYSTQRRASSGTGKVSGDQNPQRSVKVPHEFTSKHNPDTLTFIEDDDTASLSSGEVITVDKIERTVDVATTASCNADNRTIQMVGDGRTETNG